jgi:hypothetical protein
MTPSPSFAECRAAAASVARAGALARVHAVVRPRGPTGARTGAPLSVQLLLAGRRDQLIWESPDCFAWLRPPEERGRSTGRPGTRALAVLDAGWPFRLLLVPLLLLLAAVGTAVGGLATPTLPTVLAATAAVLAVVPVLVLVWRGAARLLAGPGRLVDTVVGQLRQQNWTVVVLHAADPERAGRLLVRARRAGRPTPHLVLVHRGGVTLPGGAVPRAAQLSVEPLSDHHPLLVARSPRDGVPVASEEPGRLRRGDVVVVLVVTVLVVLLTAGLVAGQEAERCATAAACAEVPATYGDAVYWMVSRLLGGDPEGLAVAAPSNRVAGVLLTVLGVYVLVTLIGTALRERSDEDLRSGPDVVRAFAERTRRTPPLRRRRRRP